MADKKRVKIPIKTYLIYLVLVTFLVTGVTFSRFIATVTGGDSATVAKPVIDLSLKEGENYVYTLNPVSMKPGDEIRYTVRVANGDSMSTITEVALSYTISAQVEYTVNPQSNENPPITAAIYVSDDPFTETLAAGPHNFGIGPIQDDHLYILILSWDSMKNDYLDYVGDKYTVTITVDWQQKVN